MLKAILLYTFLLICGLFFQGSVISSLLPSAVVPDILVVLVVYISLQHRSVPGLLGVWCLGLLADFASAVYIGPNAAAAVVVFVVAGILANRMYAERVFAVVLITFVCSIIKALTLASILIYYSAMEWSMYLLRIVVFEAGATAFIAPIVVRLLQLGSSFGRQRHGSYSSSRRVANAWGAGNR